MGQCQVRVGCSPEQWLVGWGGWHIPVEPPWSPGRHAGVIPCLLGSCCMRSPVPWPLAPGPTSARADPHQDDAFSSEKLQAASSLTLTPWLGLETQDLTGLPELSCGEQQPVQALVP